MGGIVEGRVDEIAQVVEVIAGHHCLANVHDLRGIVAETMYAQDLQRLRVE